MGGSSTPPRFPGASDVATCCYSRLGQWLGETGSPALLLKESQMRSWSDLAWHGLPGRVCHDSPSCRQLPAAWHTLPGRPCHEPRFDSPLVAGPRQDVSCPKDGPDMIHNPQRVVDHHLWGTDHLIQNPLWVVNRHLWVLDHLIQNPQRVVDRHLWSMDHFTVTLQVTVAAFAL